MAVNYQHCPWNDVIPCWLTKYQIEQAKALQKHGFEFINSEDLFEDLDFQEAQKIEDWDFIARFPNKPDEFDDYPNGNEYEIYAHCNGAIFIYYTTSDAEDFEEASDEYDEILGDFESAKKLIKSISQKHSAHINQLCLV